MSPHRPRAIAARILTGALVAACAITTATPARAADESISVNFSVAAGAPTYRASGWIYGMTEDGSGPANHFYTDVKFRAMRAGGAQLDQPGRWVSGRYDRRWNATRAQILRTQVLGGGATNQQFTLRKVTYPGNDAHDYQLVARHSAKCVDVSGVSTAARALIHQWTCVPAGQASPLNQTWRLWGR